jgi:protein phosphatase
VRVAPSQLLASEGAVYHERPHLWHLDVADRLAAAAPDLITTTRRLATSTGDPSSVAEATTGQPDRLRQRALSHKRSLALREYALGLEALDRVARSEPLWRVHECVFAVLALESEPVDPRL